MTILNLTRDASGRDTYIRRPSSQLSSARLVKDAEQSFTVPGEFARYDVIFSFSPGASVWVAINNTAAYPSGSIASTNSEQNPIGYQLLAGDVIHFITPDDVDLIGWALYAIV